ncbi:FemAB family XrtA/PEP-CTERM system-associated protein [Rubrivivax gelatinosus]|uniref:FemAB-related protein (PEP-CTERM system-associated) n=1 Tax=Rubrivivax gelatinosus TaxID=28068 RepID=A0A4R2MGM1_RUBGE|nr:FemAB family XrtA/PEP-CTERM system-associated protein [Rubrivivax gelatinosus]MBK1686117.1 peptidoglycan bridge formation protein FemAB [Rubrivivax gelatinosus]TCP05611.1 FemAB-related protein (PEP-CTERM system-associated) [Rubrivivax gelatinosus]
MTTVQRLAPEDGRLAAAWDEYVFACPQATFFHRAGWQRVLREVFRHDTHFLYAERGGRIVGVLPLARVKSLLFGHALTSLPFAVYGGAVADDEDTALLLEAAAERLGRETGVEHLELRQLARRHEGWPRQELYVTFRKQILPDEEANLLAIPRKQRAMVRKGLKNGLTSAFDDGVERFFALYADNVHRHGTPAMPRRWFQALRREFGEDCSVLTVAAPDGRPLSSVLSFYFRDEILPYYAGDDEAARELAANDFKYWELMRHACARGLATFDYGRSKQGTGPYAFKKNWGFEPTPLAYEYRLFKRESVPQHNPSNAKYQLLIRAWRKMPLAMANTIGPHIVRSLG